MVACRRRIVYHARAQRKVWAMSNAKLIKRYMDRLVDRSEFVPTGLWTVDEDGCVRGRQRAFGGRRGYQETLRYTWQPSWPGTDQGKPFTLTFRFDQTETLVEIAYNWTTWTSSLERLLEALALPALDLDQDPDGPLPLRAAEAGERRPLAGVMSMVRVRTTGVGTDAVVHLGDVPLTVPVQGSVVSSWRMACGALVSRAYEVKMSTALTCANCLGLWQSNASFNQFRDQLRREELLAGMSSDDRRVLGLE